MSIQEMLSNGSNTLLMVTPSMLQEFAQSLIAEASEKLKTQEETLYTPREFAKRHHVDVSTLWRWVRDGHLTKITVAGKVYYKDSCLKVKEG